MDLEEQARELGWVPQEQFKGDPERWVDAQTYVERGQTVMPILKKNNEKLLGEVSTLRGELGQIKTALAEANEAMTEFRKYHDETAKREYDRAVKDLRDQRLEAIEAGDHKQAAAITDALDDLNDKAPKPLQSATPPAPPPPAPQGTIHPDYPAWEAENASWLADPEKRAYAFAMAAFEKQMNPAAVPNRAFLDKLTKEVAARFKVEPPASKVEGGNNGSGRRTGGKSYNDLPADAKAACDKYEAKFVGPNKAYKTADEWRKSYVSNYDWS